MKEIYGTDVKVGDSYLDKILNEIDRENIKDSIDKAFKGITFEWIYQNKAGQILKTYYSPLVTNKNEQAVVLFTQDITDEKIREQEIYKLTFVDALTNTYNRHYFSKNFDRYNNEEQLVLLYFDVNMLKVINDAFGHNCGDDLLVFVTEALKANFKTNSEIIRMGGDEFIVIINDHPLHLVEEELSKFNEMIRNNQVLGIDISISVGLSVKDKNQEFENVLKAAEEKMYKDKFFTLESRGQRFLDNIYNRLVKEKVINSELILLQQNYALKTYNRFNSNYEDVQSINSLVKYYSLGKISKSSDSNYFIEVSYRLLSAIPKYKGIANYMRRISENYDGSGYPGKIKGDKIP